MNEAVARHLSFGKAIVFTYGPYASICTRTYSPATDPRMMLGSAAVALSYLLALLYFMNRTRRYAIVVLLVFLATFSSTETLLLSYAFLLVACVVRHLNPVTGPAAAVLKSRHIFAAVGMWSTLGLLPLVKGSLLFPYAAAVVISSSLLWHHSRPWQGLSLLLIPPAASVALWLMAGQPLYNLPSFLGGTLQLTSGYTEAMSTSWVIVPDIVGNAFVLLFIVLAIVACQSIFGVRKMRPSSRRLLGLAAALFFFVTFKHGFIAVGNVSSAFATASVLMLILWLLIGDRLLLWSLVVAFVMTASTSVVRDAVLLREVHDKFGVGAGWSGAEKRADMLNFCVERAVGAYSRSTLEAAVGTYVEAWRGIRLRMSRGDDLKARFEDAKASIRTSHPLPAMRGTADIYGYEQSILLASDNEWNPRPIIQSYSAYTRELAARNEGHLRDSDSPDWVFFEIHTIGGRLPSLDDGASWSALFDNYTYESYDGRLVLLRKGRIGLAHTGYYRTYEQTCEVGQRVTLPQGSGILFAEVDLKPTWPGRLLTALFSPPQLRIELGLANGRNKSYRVISEMMETGFLLSPLVNNTEEFAELSARSGHVENVSQVRSISIVPAYGGTVLWARTYRLTVKAY
ncbi:MAG: hypothetical protein ABSF53_10890 [Terracidiphilus sp.]